MRCHAIAAVFLTVSAACGSGSESIDPLDPELVHELTRAQGTASGDARSGIFELQFSIDTCDCPILEVERQTIDLCTISSGTFTSELNEGSGALAISTQAGLFTGAIELDDSFVVAGITDLTTLAGPLESLRRMDGQFSSDDDSAQGWAGQRLIGEIPGQTIDCRWIGSFALMRN